MRVPDFLVRQLYVGGSLRRESDGFRLQARNVIGDGRLVGIGRVSVDGTIVDPQAITATRAGDDRIYQAADVSPRTPVVFRRGDVVTIHVAKHPLAPGEHQFEVELLERDAGQLTLALRDHLRPEDG
jgi:hypothetical protein